MWSMSRHAGSQDVRAELPGSIFPTLGRYRFLRPYGFWV